MPTGPNTRDSLLPYSLLAVPTVRLVVPAMATLYVTEQGARIEKEYHRFLVTREDRVLMEVPGARLTGVVLVGNVGVTTPALGGLPDQQIPLTLLDG